MIMLLIVTEAKTKSVPLQFLRLPCPTSLPLNLAKTKQQQHKKSKHLLTSMSDSLNQKLLNIFDNIPTKWV